MLRLPKHGSGSVRRQKNEAQKEARLLLRDYVTVPLDTGARPGKELMNLKWKQITEAMKPVEHITASLLTAHAT